MKSRREGKQTIYILIIIRWDLENLSWVSDWPPMKINKGSLLTGSNSGGDLDHQPVPFSQFKQRRLPKKQKIVTVYDRELDDHIFQEPRSLWHFVSHDQSWIMIANFEKIWTTITHDHDWRSLLFTLKFLYHTTNPYTLPETSSSSPDPSMNLKNDRKWLLNFQTQSKNVSHECMLTIDHDCQFW